MTEPSYRFEVVESGDSQWGPSADRESGQLFSSCTGWPNLLGLSPRECEIARLVGRDLTNKEISAVLEISIWTVATHLRRIFAKLRVHSKAAMVAVISERIVTLNGWSPAPPNGRRSD